MIRLFFILPFLVLVAYSIHAAFKYTRMIGNIFLSLVYKPETPFSASSHGEKITILDSAGHEIQALHIVKKGSKKIVLFCHESGQTKESWEKYAYFLPALGYHVLSLDFGVGKKELERNSLSQWPTEEDVERLLTVIRWAKKAFGNPEIVLFGVSNGADIAFAASFRDPSVKAVIADGLFSMKEIFRSYIRKWAPILVKPNLFGEDYPGWVVNIFTNLGFWYCQRQAGKKFINIEKCLNGSHGPLLMIHGEFDDYVPETHQEFLDKIDAKKSGSRRLVVPKAGHNEAVILGRQSYEREIGEFLKNHA